MGILYTKSFYLEIYFLEIYTIESTQSELYIQGEYTPYVPISRINKNISSPFLLDFLVWNLFF